MNKIFQERCWKNGGCAKRFSSSIASDLIKIYERQALWIFIGDDLVLNLLWTYYRQWAIFIAGSSLPCNTRRELCTLSDDLHRVWIYDLVYLTLYCDFRVINVIHNGIWSYCTENYFTFIHFIRFLVTLENCRFLLVS